MSNHVMLTFRCSSGSHLTSMLKTSSSTDSSISAAQMGVDYDGVDDGTTSLILKTSSSSDSSTSAAQIGVDYNGVDDGATSSILKTSSSTDSSTSATQIVVEFDEVCAGSSDGDKPVKKSSKVKELSSSPKASKV